MTIMPNDPDPFEFTPLMGSSITLKHGTTPPFHFPFIPHCAPHRYILIYLFCPPPSTGKTAFWLQGPATSGAFVPPPSALMISPPSSAPPTQSHSSFPFSPSSLNPPSTLAPVPPVRTYAAAHHRLHPLSEEQFKLRMLHRNQTIVEVHSQPSTSLAEAIDGGGSIGAISNSSSDEGGMVGRGAGGGGVASADSDVDMKPATPTQITGLGATVPSTTSTTAGIIGGMSAPAPSTAATPTAAVRPTTLNLCSGYVLFFLFSFVLLHCG